MNLSTFDMNLLRVLDALLQESSTVRAGKRLGLSQPAVSNALGRLRHAFGDDLFVRQGHVLMPTDFARRLAAPLREELDRLETLLSGPGAFDPAKAELTFRLAGSDFFAEMLMPGLAAFLAQAAPGIRLQMVDLLRESYIGTIDRYGVDLSLVPDEPFPEWIVKMAMFKSGFVVIARQGHPAFETSKAGGSLSLDLFCSLDHVVFSPEGNFSAMGDAALARVGRSRRVKMTLPVFYGVCRTVSESELIALVPRQLAEKLAGTLGLAIYRPPVDIAPARIVGIWHRRSNANPAHRWLREQIAEILRPLDEQPSNAATLTIKTGSQ